MKNLLPFLFGNNAINNPKAVANLQTELFIFSIIIGVLLALIVTIIAGRISYKSGPCADKKPKISPPNDAMIRRIVFLSVLVLTAAIPIIINMYFALSKILSPVFKSKAQTFGYASSGIAVLTYIVIYIVFCWLAILAFKSYKPKTALVSSRKIFGLISLKEKKKN